MFSQSNRSFWSVLSVLLLIVIMGFCAVIAVQQAALLRDANVDIQRQLVPFSRGVVELEANLTALRGSNALLRSQSENKSADSAELLRAHNYMAQILDEAVALAALDLGDAQQALLLNLQGQVTAFQRQHDAFTALVSAAKYDKAVEHYDIKLAEQSLQFARQVGDLIGLNRRVQASSTDAAVAAYTDAYWAILGSLGVGALASLLIAGGRASWRRQRRSALAAHSVLG